ncbi:MAG TPA: YbaN family protein [Telluria sp.]
MKIWLNIVGSIAVVLAVLGVFLPLLPTTPFLLLASACFARGSERMHRWLLSNKLFGQYLRNIEEGTDMPVKAKVMTLIILWVSLGLSAFKINSAAPAILLFCIGVGVTIYLVKFLPRKRGRVSKTSRWDSAS